jgi:hypothetical protein
MLTVMTEDELETLLLQKERSNSPRISAQPSEVLFSDSPLAHLGVEASPNTLGPAHNFNTYPSSPSSTIIGSSQLRNDVAFSLHAQHNQSHSPQDLYLSASSTDTAPRPPVDSEFRLDMIWPNWPPNLPGPELLRHL